MNREFTGMNRKTPEMGDGKNCYMSPELARYFDPLIMAKIMIGVP